MKVYTRASITGMGAALALLHGSLVCRAGAQQPQQKSIQSEVRSRPLEIDRGASALWQDLLKLHTRASMLMINAHPDDEDAGQLTYESRGEGARVALLSLTRGEGGQNLMSPDLFDALGLVRGEELLEANSYYGSQLYFTPAIDFGFSKSKEEAFEKWGHERSLAEVVRVVRMFRPLVLSSVFVGGPTDGHGQHQASGQEAQEAFNDAGDPTKFPEQIREGLMPWTPLKDYAHVPIQARVDSAVGSFGDEGAVGFGKIFDYANSRTYPLRFQNYITGKWMDGMLSTDLTIPEGRFDPWLGGSYVQVGREGYGAQRSQTGGAIVPPPGPSTSAYHLFGSRVAAPKGDSSMFAGIDVSVMGIADLGAGQDNAFLKSGLADISQKIEQAINRYDPQHPDAIAPDLASGTRANMALIDTVQASSLTPEAKYNVLHELHVKQAEFNAALAASLGLSVQVSVTPAVPSAFEGRGPASTPRVVTPGQTFTLSVRGAEIGGLPVSIQRAWVETPKGESWAVTPQGSAPAQLDAEHTQSQLFQVQVPEDAKLTKPYFTRENLHQDVYTVHDPVSIDLPFADYPVSGWMEFKYDGVAVQIGQVAQTNTHEIGFGNVAEPLAVAPSISIWLPTRASVVATGAKSFDLSVLLHSNAPGAAQGTLKLELPGGWVSDPATAPFTIAKSGQDESVTFKVHPDNVQQQKSYQIRAVATFDRHEYSSGYEQTGYAGLRPYNLYYPSDYKTTGVDLKVAPGLKVGFVRGTGSQIPQSLAVLGLQTTFLGPEDLSSGDLSKFDVIILDVRAYSVRPDLATHNQRLLDFVHQGGTLIVQYQQGAYDRFAPYPLTIGTGSLATHADEESAVQFVLPDHPALNWPNKIGPQDFTGWVEERGHGFANTWGPQWQAPFEMRDPDEAPQKGGLLIAHYGKGVYVYDALALYRELSEGVPGSYRIIANLLSLSANPAFKSAEDTAGR